MGKLNQSYQISRKPPQSATKAFDSGFEAQRRHHHKWERGVSVATKMDRGPAKKSYQRPPCLWWRRDLFQLHSVSRPPTREPSSTCSKAAGVIIEVSISVTVHSMYGKPVLRRQSSARLVSAEPGSLDLKTSVIPSQYLFQHELILTCYHTQVS